MAKLTNTSKSVVKTQLTVQPGDELEIPDHVARDLASQTSELTGDIPEQESLGLSMDNTKAELLAAAEGLDVDESNTKAEILEALEA